MSKTKRTAMDGVAYKHAGQILFKRFNFYQDSFWRVWPDGGEAMVTSSLQVADPTPYEGNGGVLLRIAGKYIKAYPEVEWDDDGVPDCDFIICLQTPIGLVETSLRDFLASRNFSSFELYIPETSSSMRLAVGG